MYSVIDKNTGEQFGVTVFTKQEGLTLFNNTVAELENTMRRMEGNLGLGSLDDTVPW